MYSRCRSESARMPAALGLPLACLLACLLTASCQRERREFKPPAARAEAPADTALNSLVGGNFDLAFRAQQQRLYGDNAFQISQGQQLYRAFNCYGCHAAGGGGDIGPPLIDEKWIYGSEIDQVYLSIAQGRANGMPAFGGRIPPQQIWQLSAYVRSLGGLTPKAARPARSDHMFTPPPQEAEPKPEQKTERTE